MISNIYMPARCIVGRGCVEQSGGIFVSAGQALPDSHGQEQRKAQRRSRRRGKSLAKAQG